MHPLRFACGLLLLVVLALPSLAWAEAGAAIADTPFLTTLTEPERNAAGLSRLNEAQQAELNRFIGRELRLARAGDVVAFSGTFTTRRPASEYAAAGLATLAPEERQALDGYVARALADRPVVARPRTPPGADSVTTVSRRAEWHGEVSLMYGRSSGGGEFYGGSVTTIYDDPDKGFAAALTISQFEGDGLYWPYGYYRGYPDCRWPGDPLRRGIGRR